MSKLANVLLYLVLGGHVLNIVVTMLCVGTYVPASSQAQTAATVLVCILVAGVQSIAYGVTAAQSTQGGRWGVAISMMCLTCVGIVCFTKMGSYYVSIGDVAMTIIFAAISCGALIWLRR